MKLIRAPWGPRPSTERLVFQKFLLFTDWSFLTLEPPKIRILKLKKIKDQNHARRVDTTYLPRCIRIANAFLLILKCSESVCRVANVLFRFSELHFVSAVMPIYGKDPSSSWGLQGHPDWRSYLNSGFSKKWKFSKVEMMLGGSIQHICHGAHLSQMFSY